MDWITTFGKWFKAYVSSIQNLEINEYFVSDATLVWMIQPTAKWSGQLRLVKLGSTKKVVFKKP